MSFYNHRTSISNTTNSISPFYFDKIYTSRKQMDDACASDGVYLGRFVLVKYGDDEEHKSSLDNDTFTETLGNKWANNFWDDAIEYWEIQKSAKFEEDVNTNETTYNDGKHYYLNNGEYTLIEENAQSPAYNQNIDYYIVKSSVNVLGYDNTVWQKNLVNGEMKYVMISSLYSPKIDMTANLLNGELIGGEGITITRTSSPSGSNYQYSYRFDVNCSRGLILVGGHSLAVWAGKGLTYSDDLSKIQVDLSNSSGLKFIGQGLTVDGPGPGLKMQDNQLQVKPQSNGGLTVDNNGLSVNTGNGLNITDNKLNVDLVAGDGIAISQSDGITTIINSAPNINMSNSGQALQSRYISTSSNPEPLWDYQIVWFNGWQTYNPSLNETSFLSWIKSHSEEYPPFINRRYRHPNVKVYLNKSGDDILGGEIQIQSNYFSRRGDLLPLVDEAYERRLFNFSHSRANDAWSSVTNNILGLKPCEATYEELIDYLMDGTSSQQTAAQQILSDKWRFERSLICKLKFNTEDTKKYPELDISKLSLDDISNTTTGIWNIGTDDTINPRASWSAAVKMNKMTTTYVGITQGNQNEEYTLLPDEIIVYAVSYADGYNDQFSVYKNVLNDNKHLYTGNINIAVQGRLSPKKTS